MSRTAQRGQGDRSYVWFPEPAESTGEVSGIAPSKALPQRRFALPGWSRHAVAA